MRLAAAALAAFLICGSAAAAEPPTIVAVDKCPAKSACVAMDISIAAEEKEARLIRPGRPQCGGKVYRVRGRLRGSAVRFYHLALQGSCTSNCADGTAAYFGRSARNAPIIMTNLGRFEIVDNGVDVGVADDLIVLDETRGAIAKYIGNFAGSGDFFVERSRVYMRHDKGPCITAPQSRPGLLAAVDVRRCRAVPDAEKQFVEFKALAAASQAFVQKLAEAYKIAETLDATKYETRAGVVLVQLNDNCHP